VKKTTKADAIIAYKVFNPDWTCNGFQYAVGESFKHKGKITICSRGFHACTSLAHCFSYYSFDPKNKVAEVRLWGEIDEHNDDTKLCASDIEIVRELSWQEVLVLANSRNSGSVTGTAAPGTAAAVQEQRLLEQRLQEQRLQEQEQRLLEQRLQEQRRQ
jgi:hypothetical protein